MVILAVRFLSEQPTVREIIQRPDRAGKYLFSVVFTAVSNFLMHICLKFHSLMQNMAKVSIEHSFPAPKQNDALWTLLACESIRFFRLNFHTPAGES